MTPVQESARLMTAPPPEAFRRAMRAFGAGVTVITSRHLGQDHGMTATAFTSLTADPPMVAIAVNRTNRSHPLIAESGVFGVNILAAGQQAIAAVFATSGENQFATVDCRRGPEDIPLISGCAGHVVCRIAGRHDYGTHSLFVGSVIDCGGSEMLPLLYHGGSYAGLVRPG